MLNIRNFGAVGDNVTDDYAAIIQTLHAATATGDGVLIPAGTYYTSQQIDWNLTRDLVIRGEGDISRVGPRGSGGFLKVTSTTDYATLKIEDLRVSACAPGQTAIHYTGAPATAIHERKLLVVEGVTVDAGTHHHENAIQMAYAHNAAIRNCMFTGPGNASGSGIVINAISVNARITDTDINNWHVGILCNTYQEGLFVSSGAMVVVKYGIIFFSNQPLRNTLLQLANYHIDARGEGSIAVWCNNVSAFQMTNTLLIAEGTVLYLKRTYESQIANNQIYGPAPYGILLENGDNNLSCAAVTIIGNNFRGQHTNIYADSLTRRIIASKNTRNERDDLMQTLPVTKVDEGINNEIEGVAP